MKTTCEVYCSSRVVVEYYREGKTNICAGASFLEKKELVLDKLEGDY